MNKEELCDLTIEQKEYLIQENKYLDIFVNDENLWVRFAVAAQGYGLDILINDKSSWVRNMVRMYCKNHPNKPECKNILNLYNL